MMTLMYSKSYVIYQAKVHVDADREVVFDACVQALPFDCEWLMENQPKGYNVYIELEEHHPSMASVLYELQKELNR